MPTKLDTLFYELELRTTGFDSSLTNAKTGLTQLADTIAARPQIALLALGAAFAAVAVKAAEMGVTLESALAKVNTVAHLDTKGLDKFRDDLLDLSTQLPVDDITQLSDGLYQIVSAGIPAGQAMETLKVAAKASIGGFADLNTTAKVLAATVNAYSTTGLTAAHASDVLAKAVANGQLEFKDLASQLGDVLGIASSFNTSIEDVSAVLSALSLSGINAAQGTTALRSAIQSIIHPSSEFIQLFPALAANFNEARLKSEGFVKFLLDFYEASNHSSVALSALFRDTQAYAGVVALLGDGGKKLTDQLNAMNHAAGTTSETFNYVNETTEAAAKRLRNEFNVELYKLGTTLLPLTNAALRTLGDGFALVFEGAGALQQRIAGRYADAAVGLDRVRRATGLSTEAFADLRSTVLSLANETQQFAGEKAIHIDELLKIDPETLAKLRVATEYLKGLAQAQGIAGAVESYQRLIKAIDEVLLKQGKVAKPDGTVAERPISGPPSPKQAASGLVTPTVVLTAEQVSRLRSFTDAVKSFAATGDALHEASVKMGELRREADALLAQKALTPAEYADRLKQIGDGYASVAKRVHDEAQSRVEQTRAALTGFTSQLAGLTAKNADDPVAQIGESFGALTHSIDEAIAHLPKEGSFEFLKLPPDVQESYRAIRAELVGLDEDVQRQRGLAVAKAQLDLFTQGYEASLAIVGTATEQADYAVQKLGADLAHAKVAPEVIAKAQALTKALADARQKSEQLQRDLKAIGESSVSPMEKARELLEKQLDLQRQLNDLHGDDVTTQQTRVQLENDLASVDAQLAGLGAANADHLAEAVTSASNLASEMGAVLDVAFGLSSAILGADNALTRMIGSASQVAHGLSSIIDITKNLQGGFSAIFSSAATLTSALPGIGQIIGGGLAIASTLSGLFSRKADPEAAAQRAAVQANTQALKDLRQGLTTVNPLSISSSKASAIANTPFTKTTQQYGELGGQITDIVSNLTSKEIIANLRSVGVSLGDLKKAAEDLGIPLSNNPTPQELKNLAAAIKEFGKIVFDTSAQGQLAEQDALSKLHGDDATKTLTDRIEKLKGIAPAVNDALAGIDTTTVEGRAEALKKLIALGDDIAAGKEGIDGGTLSMKDLFAEILSAVTGLRGVDSKGATHALDDYKKRLDIFSQALDASGADAGQRLGKLDEFFKQEFANVFKDVDVKAPIADVRAKFLTYIAQAAGDGNISEDEQAVIDAFKSIIAAIQAAGDEAKSATSAADQAAADARAKIIENAKTGAQLTGANPDAALAGLVAAYAKALPKLGDLLAGATTPDEIIARVTEIFAKLKDGSITAESVGAPLEELVSDLLDLRGAAGDASNAIAGLADKLSSAFDDIDVQAQLDGITDAATLLGKKLDAVGLKGSDLGSDAGRASTLAQLQALAAANPNDKALRQILAQLATSVRGLSPIVDAVAAGDAASGRGETNVRGGAVLTATIAQADVMIGLLTTILSVISQVRDLAKRLVEFSVATASVGGGSAAVASAAIGASASGGSGGFVITFYNAFNFYGPVSAEDRSFARDNLTRIAEQIDEALGDIQRAKFANAGLLRASS